MTFGRTMKRTFPLASDFAVATLHFLQRVGKRHPPQHWSQDMPAMSDRAGLCDIPTAEFLRLVLEGGYREVIEIGTYTGARISTLKRLLPQITAHGMDIGPRFAEPFESHGVSFRRYDAAFFCGPFEKPLLVCVQTLVCFDEAELGRLLAACAEGGVDVACFEVQPLFNLGEGVAPVDRVKTGGTGWYHDYTALFARHGFTNRFTGEDKPWSHTGHTKTLERWQPFYFSAPAKRVA